MAGHESTPTAPEDLASDELCQQLGVAQARVRAMMQEFNIPSGQLHAMAHAAEKSITDTGLRADFLLALIDLHSFGREAKRRKLLRPSGGLQQLAIGDAPHTRGSPHSNDGMRLDSELNIIACAGWNESGPGPMIYVFAPNGRVLETHPFPINPTNCAFGGEDLQSLYVTAIDGFLYRARTHRKGLA